MDGSPFCGSFFDNTSFGFSTFLSSTFGSTVGTFISVITGSLTETSGDASLGFGSRPLTVGAASVVLSASPVALQPLF